MRVEAETEYSQKLFRISDKNQLDSIKVGLLAKEVDSLKADCRFKAKAAAELAENVASDCVEPLRVLIETQDQEFKRLVNESRMTISSMDDLNNRIRVLAQRYFEASENAEKFIHNYQELKLNMDIPYKKRKSLHDSVFNTISISRDREQAYQSSIDEANRELQGYIKEIQVYADKMREFEKDRCEQIHSSINQFVVFEKFAEMNNKYDVKNFSDLIDQFKVDDEMQVIDQTIREAIESSRYEQRCTIFDPFIPTDRLKAEYKFAEYKGRRYALKTLDADHKLLKAPPQILSEHEDSHEILNFVLDRAFVEQRLNDEYITTFAKLLQQKDCRESLLGMLEKDYKNYEIDFMRPYEIEKRNIRVILPYVIYGNILEIFTMFLDIESQNLNVVNLLKFMLFARLFQFKFKVSDY